MLIQGDTGTGKELVAKVIHQNSPRKKRPFVLLDPTRRSVSIFSKASCSVTFAGRSPMRRAIARANSNTRTAARCFSNEVGDMPIPTQIKLLRVLESGADHARGLERAGGGRMFAFCRRRIVTLKRQLRRVRFARICTIG